MYSLCDGDCDVIDGQPPLEEEVLPHVGQRRRRVDRVPPHAIPLQVRRRVATLSLIGIQLVLLQGDTLGCPSYFVDMRVNFQY